MIGSDQSFRCHDTDWRSDQARAPLGRVGVVDGHSSPLKRPEDIPEICDNNRAG